MAEADLQRFLRKVEQLNALVASLEEDPLRRQTFAACVDHNQVVQLARSWGFEIGRRWGEASADLEGSMAEAPCTEAAPCGKCARVEAFLAWVRDVPPGTDRTVSWPHGLAMCAAGDARDFVDCLRKPDPQHG